MKMFHKDDIEKMVRQILRQHKKLKSPQIMHPAREWQIGIFVSAVILIVSMVWSANSYISNRNLNVNENVSSDTSVPVYRASLVTESLDYYEDREVIRMELLGQASDIVINTATSSTSTTTPTSDISIQDEFPEKIVYGSNSDISEEELRNHCALEGGTFNTCGSVCPKTAEACTLQCAFTCEFE